MYAQSNAIYSLLVRLTFCLCMAVPILFIYLTFHMQGATADQRKRLWMDRSFTDVGLVNLRQIKWQVEELG